MAGLGRKVFTRERATVADVQGYLMDQTVMNFPSASARNAAIPSPSKGMHVYRSDLDSLERYNGSAWVRLVNGGYITGVASDSIGIFTFNHLLGTTPRWVNVAMPAQPTDAISSVLKLMAWTWTSTTISVRTYRHDGTNGAASPFATSFNCVWSAGTL